MDCKRTAYHCYVVRYYKEADEDGLLRRMVVLTFPRSTRPSWEDEDMLLIERSGRMCRGGEMSDVSFKKLNVMDSYVENGYIVVNIGRNVSIGSQTRSCDSIYLHLKEFPKQKSVSMGLKWIEDVELDTE